MRRGLAAGAVLATSVFVAGCGGEAETPPTDPGGSSGPAPTSEQKESERTAPVKSLELANNCSIVTVEQASAIGADQPPREREANGVSGCNYDLGETGKGFMVFVAADSAETMQEFRAKRSSSVEMIDIAGYPTAEVGTTDINCMLSLDVSDEGSLLINTVAREGPDPCEVSKKFAEAAVENLPDA